MGIGILVVVVLHPGGNCYLPTCRPMPACLPREVGGPRQVGGTVEDACQASITFPGVGRAPGDCLLPASLPCPPLWALPRPAMPTTRALLPVLLEERKEPCLPLPAQGPL